MIQYRSVSFVPGTHRKPLRRFSRQGRRRSFIGPLAAAVQFCRQSIGIGDFWAIDVQAPWLRMLFEPSLRQLFSVSKNRQSPFETVARLEVLNSSVSGRSYFVWTSTTNRSTSTNWTQRFLPSAPFRDIEITFLCVIFPSNFRKMRHALDLLGISVSIFGIAT